MLFTLKKKEMKKLTDAQLIKAAATKQIAGAKASGGNSQASDCCTMKD
ncbi:hypothetical protein [Pseudoalteromonas xiamenensis]|uniref:Uncharacterized protein n=1 Tax=Pseudoalteromonas xiamenensis TaxID=882626 RepID=A0A975DJJ2_9GAMM|nr:hypothetical protein [Pseudoalteromonas xiamenensis]QTH72275.1 hypothetical protein J5O05_05210 [Pseudoalteromonas xiamenensis]